MDFMYLAAMNDTISYA